MFSKSRRFFLRLLRVPPDPAPPAGAPGSLRVFRGGRNLYKLRLLRWGVGQAGALLGIIVSLTFLDQLEGNFAAEKARRAAPAPASAPPPPKASAREAPSITETSDPAAGKSPSPTRRQRNLARVIDNTPSWLFPLIKFFELVGILAYLAQVPFTYALVRLDFELRWYMVTDRSLRIRAGIATVQESTMSFANVQQVMVSQGPVQRLLGIADVRVQSAGGGSVAPNKGAGDSLHTGIFHGVENAPEIRDLILERLRRFRESGLGDPDDTTSGGSARAVRPALAPAVAAARELLAEARSLRRQLA